MLDGPKDTSLLSGQLSYIHPVGSLFFGIGKTGGKLNRLAGIDTDLGYPFISVSTVIIAICGLINWEQHLIYPAILLSALGDRLDYYDSKVNIQYDFIMK
ncbi:hypothetical protein ACVSUJ_05825 [Yersinia enterocolitica]